MIKYTGSIKKEKVGKKYGARVIIKFPPYKPVSPPASLVTVKWEGFLKNKRPTNK